MADYNRQYRLWHLVFFLGFVLSSGYVLTPALEYVTGFWPFQAGPEAEQEWLNKLHGRQAAASARFRFECRDGEAGWDYICTRFPPEDPRQKHSSEPVRVGIRHRIYSFEQQELPGEGPIPTREFLHAQREARSRALKEGFDLNTARVDQLVLVPFVNEDVARRIVSAAKNKPFERVEDLLKIEGINQYRLEYIRQYVRVGPPVPSPAATPASKRASRSG